MAVVSKPVYKCDHCDAEMGQPFIWTEDVPHEGSSTISTGHGKGLHTFDVGGQHYCSLYCLFNHIQKTLFPKLKPIVPQ